MGNANPLSALQPRPLDLPPVFGASGVVAPAPAGNILTKGLSSLLGAAGPVGALFDIGSQIAGLFKTSPQGKAKQEATRSQLNIEQWMKDIEKQVVAGTMDPDTGIAMIQNIARQAIGSDQYGGAAAGQAQVNAMASQIIANMNQRRNWNLQAGLGEGGNADRIMSGSTPAGPEFQKERGATLLRNLALGTNLGKEFAASGAPAGRAMQANPLSTGEFANAFEQARSLRSAIPGVQPPSSGELLKKKLATYGS